MPSHFTLDRRLVELLSHYFKYDYFVMVYFVDRPPETERGHTAKAFRQIFAHSFKNSR